MTPARFRGYAVVTLVALVAIVLSGAAVRLTGSGLGCPDWPTCYRHRLTGSSGAHAVIEYGNRFFTGVLVIVAAAAFVAAWRRVPRRRDLVALTGLVVTGVVADALLGALVVYSRLNPWLVALHLILSLAMVALGTVLVHRATHVYNSGTNAVVRDARYQMVARLLWIPFGAALVAGTVATGTGPHAGGSQGQLVARRLPIAFSSGAAVHSIAAMVFVAVVVGTLFAVWHTSTPTQIQKGARRLAVVSFAQAVLGYSQYALHVPVLLVELHVLGAVALTMGVVQFNLRQIARERESWWTPIFGLTTRE